MRKRQLSAIKGTSGYSVPMRKQPGDLVKTFDVIERIVNAPLSFSASEEEEETEEKEYESSGEHRINDS